jgi:hypothetical protein
MSADDKRQVEKALLFVHAGLHQCLNAGVVAIYGQVSPRRHVHHAPFLSIETWQGVQREGGPLSS